MHGVTTTSRSTNASGPNLRKLLRGKPPRIRAVAAAKLVTGEWLFTRPLPAQAARLCRVTPALVSKALGRPPRRRSDHELDRLVIRLGADRVLAPLDRITRPVIGGAS